MLMTAALGLLLTAPDLPVPTPEQLAWQRLELTMFVHFGVNTFTDREWGHGDEDEAVFNPTDLDCNQWVAAARDAGFKLIILTAKHHDGFCLWPSKYTEHSVRSSPWRGGQGDVVREFTDACRAAGIKVGLYLSPWDRNNPAYGTEGYNDHFVNQLTELLTNYGTIDEVWFDGANGEGPNGKKQVYAWDRFYATIRELMPHALIAIAGPDIRWVGNESGVAKIGEASARDGKWRPAECDVSIRPGWFYHAAEDTKVKSLDHLINIYFQSVGRNSVLLLNVPPDRRGRFADPDVARLHELGEAIRAIQSGRLPATSPEVAVLDDDPETTWSPEGDALTGTIELTLAAQPFNVVGVQEAIAQGERVQKYRIDASHDGAWETIARGTTIGHRNLHPVKEQQATRLRLVIEASRATPLITTFAAYHAPIVPAPRLLSLTTNKPAKVSNVHGQGTTYGGDRAVDGDQNTRWATSDETRACWLEVDLEQPETFDKVAISELEPRIIKFDVQYRMTPDEEWRVALAGEQAGKQYTNSFPAVTGRYVRLNILEATFAPTIWEFEVFGGH